MGTVSSTQVSNYLDNNPPIVNQPAVAGGSGKRTYADTMELTTGNLAAAEVIELAIVSVEEIPTSIRLAFDDLGGTMTADLGLYTLERAVVDVDALGAAIDLATASTALDEKFASTATTKAQVGQKFWEIAAGVTATPGGQYIIALTMVTSTTPAAGTLSWVIETAATP